MAAVQHVLTAEQVSQYLIGNGLYLTGLEFLVEGQELGGFDLRFLQNFYSDTLRFPSEEVQRFQGEDALSSILLAKEREQKLCLAEYELRVATEDLKQTKDYSGMYAMSTEDTTTPEIAVDFSTSPKQENGMGDEKKHLNSVVMAYLMQCGYKVTALTFQEEAFPEFEKKQPAGHTLAQYYHQIQEQEKDSEKRTGGGDAVKENGISAVSVPELQGDNKSDGVTSDSTEKSERVMTPDVVSMKHVTSNGVSTDGDVDSEPMTPLNVTTLPKIPMHTPSTDLLTVLMEYLPKIIPSVLIKKRSDCIPVLVALSRDHPDASCRMALQSMLFSLIKHPDDEQRQSMVHGIELLAESVGSQRINQEIIPQCCELANHKRHEKRLMVAEILGVICHHVEDDIRSSLLLSLLRQLSADPHALVRRAALTSLSSCLKVADIPAHKERSVEDLLIDFVTDMEATVSDAAFAELVPILRESQGGLHLNGHTVQRIFGDVHDILDSAPSANLADKSSDESGTVVGRLPKNPQQKKILSLLNLYEAVLPQFAKICAEGIPFWVTHNLRKSESNDPLTPAADKERNSLNLENGSEKRALAFEQWFDETQETETSSEAHLFVSEILPSILSIISRIAPVNECLKLRERLVSTIRATHKAIEWCIAEGAMKPLFLAASGLDDVYPITCLTRSKALMDVIRRRRTECEDRASVFPICFAGIFSENEEDALHDFILSLLNTNDPARTPWALEHKQVFISAVVFSGNFVSTYKILMNFMVQFSTSAGGTLKCGAALIAEALCLHASYQDVFSTITPVLSCLAKDTDLSVRLHVITALRQIATMHPNSSELMEKVYAAVENILTSDLPQVKLTALRAFSSAASQCNIHATFVLKQIPGFLDALQEASPDMTPPLHLRPIATAVFDSLLVLEGVEILDSSLRGQLVVLMENLMQVASSYLDNAQRQILSAMVSDQTSKLGQFKRRLRSSLGSKKASVSSDVSFASDSSHVLDS